MSEEFFIRVNGAMETLAVKTIKALMEARGLAGEGLAVALNEQLVPKSAWATTLLHPEDQVEIVRAIGGG
ncbi:MAG TPA: sulfur carrier protein ThiS [Acetobacteraceae bacterium]|nr:sulfur carrier protein ThiS [Acetobacteraceae bacterium]